MRRVGPWTGSTRGWIGTPRLLKVSRAAEGSTTGLITVFGRKGTPRYYIGRSDGVAFHANYRAEYRLNYADAIILDGRIF
jgi:hypothetical protein